MHVFDKRTNFFIAKTDGLHSATDTVIPVTSLGSPVTLQVPCNVTWYNHTDFPGRPAEDPNREIVRVTLAAGAPTTSLTVVRGQEGIAATVKDIAGKEYRIFDGVTAKRITDIEAAITTNETDIAGLNTTANTEYMYYYPINTGWSLPLTTLTRSLWIFLTALYNDTLDIQNIIPGTIFFPPLASLFQGQTITVFSPQGGKFRVNTSGVAGSVHDQTYILLPNEHTTFVYDTLQWREKDVSVDWILSGATTPFYTQKPLKLIFSNYIVSSATFSVPTQRFAGGKRVFSFASTVGALTSVSISLTMGSVSLGDEIEVVCNQDVSSFTIASSGSPAFVFNGVPAGLSAGKPVAFRLQSLLSGVFTWERFLAPVAAVATVDAITSVQWIGRDCRSIQPLQAVAFGIVSGVRTLLACGLNTVMRSIDDGKTWAITPSPPLGNWFGIAFKAGTFCMIEDNGISTHQSAISTNGGDTWTAALSGTAGRPRLVAGASNFIGVSNTVSTGMTSPTGLAPWTPRTLSGGTYFDVVYDAVNARAITTGKLGFGAPRVAISVDDGVTWVESDVATPNFPILRVVVPNTGGFVAFGDTDDSYVFVDPIVVPINSNVTSLGLRTNVAGSLWGDAINAAGAIICVGSGPSKSGISFDNGYSWTFLPMAHGGPWTNLTSFLLPSGRTRVVAVSGTLGTIVTVGTGTRVQTLDI